MFLIVDDYPDNSEALRRLLGGMGYECETAASGPEALAMIRSFSGEWPLLVILDDMMPGVSGLDVLRELRRDPRTARVPVVIYSGGHGMGRRDEALALGAKDWIIKGRDLDLTLKSFLELYRQIGGSTSDQERQAKFG